MRGRSDRLPRGDAPATQPGERLTLGPGREQARDYDGERSRDHHQSFEAAAQVHELHERGEVVGRPRPRHRDVAPEQSGDEPERHGHVQQDDPLAHAPDARRP